MIQQFIRQFREISGRLPSLIYLQLEFPNVPAAVLRNELSKFEGTKIA